MVIFQSIYSFLFGEKAREVLWLVLCFVLFKPFFLPLFRTWRIVLLRLFGAKLHMSCTISSRACIPRPWNLAMGAESMLMASARLGMGQVFIGQKVMISEGAYLCSSKLRTDSIPVSLSLGDIHIQDFCWIGTGSFIGSGVLVGEGAVVEARSSVFKNVLPWTVVIGNPAKFWKERRLS